MNINNAKIRLIELEGHVLPLEVKSGRDYKKHNALNNVLTNDSSLFLKTSEVYNRINRKNVKKLSALF